jgi:hypothetical protein
MEAITKRTGKTEKEIKALYLSAIDTFIHFGMSEEQARIEVQKAFRESLGL